MNAQDQAVVAENMVTDEINVVKAEEVAQAIAPETGDIQDSQAYHDIVDPLGLDKEVARGEQREPESTDPIPTLSEGTPLRDPKQVLLESLPLLNELATKNDGELQKQLEAIGMTVDFKKVMQAWLNATTWEADANDIIKPLSEVACACDTCLEENADVLRIEDQDNVPCDVDTDMDTLAMLYDMSARLAKLEQRIAEYNVRSSHKI